MRRSRSLIAIAVFAGALLAGTGVATALPPPPPPTPGPGEMAVSLCFDPTLICHQVQPGEWLWKLARLSVPGALPVRPALTDLSAVARRVQELRDRNRGVLGGSDRLRVGQVLVVADRVQQIDLTCDEVVPPLGAADDGRAINVPSCGTVSISLEECGSCGYSWRIVTAPDPSVLSGPQKRVIRPATDPASPRVGGSETAVFDLAAVRAGTTRLQLGYFPPAASAPERTFDLVVTVT